MIGDILKSADLLLKWASRQDARDDEIFSYVERISEDADDLARLWTSALTDLLDGEQQVDLGEGPEARSLLSSERRPLRFQSRILNAREYSRIENFYHRLHVVLGGYDKQKADLLLDKLSRLMEARNLSRDALATVLDTGHVDDKVIAELITEINKQAAEIRGFSMELRARR